MFDEVIKLEVEFFAVEDTNLDNFQTFFCEFFKEKTIEIQPYITIMETKEISLIFVILTTEEYIEELLTFFHDDIYTIIPDEFAESLMYGGVELDSGNVILDAMNKRLELCRQSTQMNYVSLGNHKEHIEKLLQEITELKEEIKYLKIWVHEGMDTPTLWGIMEQLCVLTKNEHLIEEHSHKFHTIH